MGKYYKRKKIIICTQVGFFPEIQGWFNIHKSINLICHLNKPKDRNHMISIFAGGKTDKAQHAFVVKVLKGCVCVCRWLCRGCALHSPILSPQH